MREISRDTWHKPLISMGNLKSDCEEGDERQWEHLQIGRKRVHHARLALIKDLHCIVLRIDL